MTKVIQTGLTCKTGLQMELFAQRVEEFNKACGFVSVECEGKEATDGHWDVVLHFRSRPYMREFWTDPKYNVKDVVAT